MVRQPEGAQCQAMLLLEIYHVPRRRARCARRPTAHLRPHPVSRGAVRRLCRRQGALVARSLQRLHGSSCPAPLLDSIASTPQRTSPPQHWVFSFDAASPGGRPEVKNLFYRGDAVEIRSYPEFLI